MQVCGARGYALRRRDVRAAALEVECGIVRSKLAVFEADSRPGTRSVERSACSRIVDTLKYVHA